MRILENVMTAAVLLHLFLFMTAPPASMAEITSLKLRSQNQNMIFFSEFEFSHHGYVSFLISSFTVSPPAADPSRIGFILELPDTQYYGDLDPVCALDSNNSLLLFTFQHLSHDYSNNSFNKSYPVKSPGTYSLLFVNCNNGESLVTMNGRAELYNTDIINGRTTKNYLSAGLTHLPRRYLIVSLVYSCYLLFWMFVCFKNRRVFHTVQLLMTGLLVMNILQLICAAGDVYHVEATGTPNGLDLLFCIFQLIRNVLLFTVIAFICSGWCIWKPTLNIFEKLFLVILIVVKVWGNVYSILAWKTGPYNYEDGDKWETSSLIINFVCYFLILIPTALSTNSLNKWLEEKSVRNWGKLCLFVIVVTAYMVFIPVIYDDSVPLVDYLVDEISLLVLCPVMLCIYWPGRPDTDDHNAAAVPVEIDPSQIV